MSLPIDWVENIFHKLTLVYDRDFTGRWEGVETADVIDDWAHELAGFENWPEAVAWALKNLPAGKPPTVLEFRALCFKAPKPDRPALPEPPANPERVCAELSKLGRPAPVASSRNAWIEQALSRMAGGWSPTPTVRKMILEAAQANRVPA